MIPEHLLPRGALPIGTRPVELIHLGVQCLHVVREEIRKRTPVGGRVGTYAQGPIFQ